MASDVNTEPFAKGDLVPYRQNDWRNIIFFSITTLIAVIGTPWYLMNFDLTTFDVILFMFYIVTTGASITVGYHRLYAHATYKANWLVRFLLLFFGAAAFEQSALRWACQHRVHHKHVDTEDDPYNIKRGFFYAHMGWLIFWQHPTDFTNVKDLQKDKMVMHQHNHYKIWAFSAGIILPILIGAAVGHFWSALILAVCLRLTFVYHATFLINSACHMFGKATYDIHASAKDHWFIAFLTYGEGYHNFHHRFPSDYRNAVVWYQWDPSKWCIYALSLIGFTSDLKRVPVEAIARAKAKADEELAKLAVS